MYVSVELKEKLSLNYHRHPLIPGALICSYNSPSKAKIPQLVLELHGLTYREHPMDYWRKRFSYTVKPAYVVTSIKRSPTLSSHIFWVP